MIKSLFTRGIIIVPVFLLGLFSLPSCTEELQEPELGPLASQQEAIVGPKDNQEFANLELFFEHLASQPTLSEMTVAEQFVSMQGYAQTVGIPFDLDRAIASHEQGVQIAATGVWEFDPTIFDYLNFLLERYGFSDELGQHIDTYLEEMSTNPNGWSEGEVELVEAHATTLRFLGQSSAFSDYLTNSGLGEDLKCEPRNALLCASYTAAAIAYSIKCAKLWFTIVPCLLAASAIASAIYYCGNDGCNPGSDPTSPCFNSPNPCCGIVCMEGYFCDSTTNGLCLPEDDPFSDCIDCAPWEQCINFKCVPL